MTTSSEMVTTMVSTTGQIINDSWPLFYLFFGTLLALACAGILYRTFKQFGRQFFR